MDILLKKIHQFLEENEGTNSAKILWELVAALEADNDFRVTTLYELPYEAFEFALHVLKDGRLASYCCKPDDLSNAITQTSIGSEASWLGTVETKLMIDRVERKWPG